MLHQDRRKYSAVDREFEAFTGKLMTDLGMDLNDGFDKEILIAIVELQTRIKDNVIRIEDAIKERC